MSASYPLAPLGSAIDHRKEFFRIDDLKTYKRCRVQLHAKGIVLRDVVYGSEIKTKKQQACRAGEFLVAEIDAKVGGFGVVPASLDEAIVSSHYFLFSINENVLDRRFLDYFVRTPDFRGQVSAQGSTNYAAIRPSHVLEYKIPLPPLPEQRRIVARIEELAARIEEAHGLRRQAAKEGNALLPSSITQALDGALIDGCLGDVLAAKPRNGWSVRCDNAEGGIPVLTLAAVTGFRYRAGEYKRTSEFTVANAHYWLHPGDLLITRSNTLELVGHAAIYSGSPEPCIYPDLMMRLVIDENRADKRFVHYWLMSTPARFYIRKYAKGTSPSMKKISQGTVVDIPFPSKLPMHEQRRIVTYLNDLRGKVDSLQHTQAESDAELDALLPSILDRAFKGRL